MRGMEDGDGDGEVKVQVQRCMNLMEAMADASKGVKNYRTHCNSICLCVLALHNLLLHYHHHLHLHLHLHHLPTISAASTRDLFAKFNASVEKAVDTIRIVSSFNPLDKALCQGPTKDHLQAILENIQMVSKEMESFLQYHMKSYNAAAEWKPLGSAEDDTAAVESTANNGGGISSSSDPTHTSRCVESQLPDLIDFAVDECRSENRNDFHAKSIDDDDECRSSDCVHPSPNANTDAQHPNRRVNDDFRCDGKKKRSDNI